MHGLIPRITHIMQRFGNLLAGRLLGFIERAFGRGVGFIDALILDQFCQPCRMPHPWIELFGKHFPTQAHRVRVFEHISGERVGKCL